MASHLTEEWKRLFKENCLDWDPMNQQRYLNIPNDREDVDAEELDSCKELIADINSKKS